MRKHSKVESKGKGAIVNLLPFPVGNLFIGIDTGDRWSHICVLEEHGEVVHRRRVETSPAAFQEHLAVYAGARVALETGVHSGWMSRTLQAMGLDVVVANAREVRKIHQSNKKNDRADAETLARLVRVDPQLLCPVQHRSAQAQCDIAILRARDGLVRSRTRLISGMRGLVKSSGARLRKCSTDAFARTASACIPEALQPALIPVLTIIDQLTTTIREYDKKIEDLAQKRYPETALLLQVTGVGALTAVAYVLTIADKTRFMRSRDVGPYLGLVPRQYDSGDVTSQLPITKAGNSYMRRLLVGSAQYILGPFGPDCNLRRYGLRLAERGGKNAKKRAVVAVARKLAVLLQTLWNTGVVYEPLHQVVPKRRRVA